MGTPDGRANAFINQVARSQHWAANGLDWFAYLEPTMSSNTTWQIKLLLPDAVALNYSKVKNFSGRLTVNSAKQQLASNLQSGQLTTSVSEGIVVPRSLGLCYNFSTDANSTVGCKLGTITIVASYNGTWSRVSNTCTLLLLMITWWFFFYHKFKSICY